MVSAQFNILRMVLRVALVNWALGAVPYWKISTFASSPCDVSLLREDP